MVHLRSRDHGCGLHHRADLRHQYRARPRAHPGELRRRRRDRLHRQAGEDADARRAALHPHATGDRNRRDPRARHRRIARLAPPDRRSSGRGRQHRRRLHPARYRLHHLHQRHRRRAARGDAAPWRDPPQCRRLLHRDPRGFPGRGRSVSLLPAAQPRVRAHRGPVPADRLWRPDLLCRGAGTARLEHRGMPADDHDRRAPPVRGAAHTHRQDDRQAGRPAKAPPRQGAGGRAEGL